METVPTTETVPMTETTETVPTTETTETVPTTETTETVPTTETTESVPTTETTETVPTTETTETVPTTETTESVPTTETTETVPTTVEDFDVKTVSRPECMTGTIMHSGCETTPFPNCETETTVLYGVSFSPNLGVSHNYSLPSLPDGGAIDIPPPSEDQFLNQHPGTYDSPVDSEESTTSETEDEQQFPDSRTISVSSSVGSREPDQFIQHTLYSLRNTMLQELARDPEDQQAVIILEAINNCLQLTTYNIDIVNSLIDDVYKYLNDQYAIVSTLVKETREKKPEEESSIPSLFFTTLLAGSILAYGTAVLCYIF